MMSLGGGGPVGIPPSKTPVRFHFPERSAETIRYTQQEIDQKTSVGQKDGRLSCETRPLKPKEEAQSAHPFPMLPKTR